MFTVIRDWATLWTVTTTATQTNERVVGITGANPLSINPYYRSMLVGIRVSAKVNLPLAAVRIYGAGNVNGFPPANTPLEALVTSITDVGLNQGILRIAASRNRDNGEAAPVLPGTQDPLVIDQLPLVPRFLLLEYSTGAPGATPTITFVVEACFIGQTPQATN